jgi:cytochrome P450
MSDAVHYDPYSASMHEDPFPTYRRLRDEAPLYHSEELGFWALSRFDDVRAAASDWRAFISGEGVDLDDAGRLFGLNSFLDMDPPRHDALRAFVRAWFTPKAVRELEARTREVVADLLAPLARGGHGDLAHELAWPLPLTMVGELLGLPAADRDFVREQFELLVRRNVGDPALPPSVLPERARVAGRELRGYFTELMSDRLQEPRDDVLSEIAAASHSERASFEEAISICNLLFLAGIETTASLLSNSLHVLAQEPEKAELLRQRPDLMPRAIEELLRYESPVQHLARTTTRAVSLHDAEIPAEARIVLVHGAANRDERRFPNPDVLDFERETKRTLAFGEGIHFCLGAPLARPEARIALARFLARVESFELCGAPVRTHTGTAYGFERLPCVLRRRRCA